MLSPSRKLWEKVHFLAAVAVVVIIVFVCFSAARGLGPGSLLPYG